MGTKKFCDCCGKEGNVNSVSIPCHLWSKSTELGYADNDGNRASGRLDNVDFCNKCLNVFYTGAIKALMSESDWQGMEVK